ncbi:hypothetical protein LP414_12455 [Polaromonas sp. P1(28)-13]|nr:hypothetical protein LP414_12455 [Polaromonas sp. P1(28)-13]
MLSLIGLSFPSFVSAILMLLVFAIELRWFPVIGNTGSRTFTEQLHNLALPAFNLGLIMTAYVMRVTFFDAGCDGRGLYPHRACQGCAADAADPAPRSA